MTANRHRDGAAFPDLGTRIRGRLRGLETVWSFDRFSELVHGEVAKGLDRAWTLERIRRQIHEAYEIHPQSLPDATRVIDRALGAAQRRVRARERRTEPHTTATPAPGSRA